MESQEFIKVFADAVEIDDMGSITFETNFRDLDEWGSLAATILGAELEKLGYKINVAEIRNCVTVGDIFNLIK